MTRDRRPGRGGALLIAAALLAGCSTIRTTPGWEPRSAPAPDAAIAVDASHPESPEPAGLDDRLVYSAESGVGARWAEIPGNDRFNETLRGRVRDAIDEQADATGVPYGPVADASPGSRGCAAGAARRPAGDLVADSALTPPTGGRTVTVVCEIVSAAGPVLAEALRVVIAVGAEVLSDTTTVYYADTSAFLTTSDALVTDDGLRTLLARVVQSLKLAAGALEPQMKEDPAAYGVDQLRAWFSDFRFGADGSLVVRLPDGFSTTELAELANLPTPSALEVTIAGADAAPLLSADGAQVLAASASGADLTLPGAPPPGREEVDCALFACLALTFDDGPGPYTADVLDALAARRATATFFLQGVAVSRYRSVLIRMRDEGHQIANHSWNHPDLRTLPAPEVSAQISRTAGAIESVTGETPTMFRPPYGGYDDGVLGAAGLPAILWSLDTNDWQEPGDAVLLQRAVEKAQPGDIVLLHDVHRSTARVVPEIVEGLQGRGFTLVTVEQLLGGTPAAGTATRR